MLNLDFVLFEPAKSADPPIKLFLNLNNEFKTASEDFLVANGFNFAITSFFCFIIELEKLLLNNSVIHPNITLRNSGYTIDIKLKDGLNTIEFFALNEGTASPNTAELKVFDENSAIIGSGQWLLTTGYKARLIVLHQ